VATTIVELEKQESPVSAGDGITAAAGMWTFSGVTSANFDKHVTKSVPLYKEGHELVCKLSEFFVGPESTCFEIGCSTGTLLCALAQQHANKNGQFVGIEIERDMADVAIRRCAGIPSVKICHADALSYDFAPADLIVAYYTVQFVLPKHRQELINRLYASLNWGGALFLFEKVRAPDARFQDLVTQTYIEYKLEQGYSADEILGKSRSLKRVLEPFSSAANVALLRRAGFEDVVTVMKYLCFEGFLAIK